MKAFCFILTLISFTTYAQSVDENAINALKAGAGYTREFPGLSGYTLTGELVRDMTPFLQGAVGFKRVNVSGHPRSAKIEEYTKATTLDFTLYFLPLRQENHIIKLGGGYSFSFYDIRRSYPVIEQVSPGSETTNWNIKEDQGRVSGFTLAAEYEYLIPYSLFSLGARASLFKAYTRVIYMGPFVAVHF
ncbi:MAG: hypothetical protein WKF97_09245 [Chitinophagaceae bacterium]